MDSWFPSLKIYNRNGQLYTSVDAELMLAYKESEVGQILHEGINEAGSTASFTAVGHLVRHPRRADDPALHLLFDVRVPAHRRRPLGGGRPDGARLRARRHRGPHHADRRGPAARRRAFAAAGLHQSRGGGLRPGVRLRDRPHRARAGCAGCTATNPENIFYYITLYNEPYVQPAEPDGLDVEGAAAGHLPLPAPPRRSAPASRRSWCPVSPCPRRCGRRSCWPTNGTWPADVWSVTTWGELNRDGVGDREGTTAPSRTPGRRAVHHQGAGRRGGAGGRGVGLDARGARADPAVGARHLHHAGHRRVRLLRHPAGGAPRTSTPTPSRSWWPCWRAWPATASIDSSVAVDAARKYQIDDVDGGAGVRRPTPGVRLPRARRARGWRRTSPDDSGVAFRRGRQSLSIAAAASTLEVLETVPRLRCCGGSSSTRARWPPRRCMRWRTGCRSSPSWKPRSAPACSWWCRPRW